MATRRSRLAEAVVTTLLLTGVAVAAAPASGAAPSPPAPRAASVARAGEGPRWTAAVTDLRVVGDALVSSGTPLEVLGVNRSGTEYACSEGWGIFDGPSTLASVDAMRAWRINTVRVPLNEDCWLGINGTDPAFSGAPYRSAIRAWVHTLRRVGMGVILDLHLTAPGRAVPSSQAPMPDASHSVALWRSVAATFRRVPGVAYEIYNEPRDVDWNCWLRGCEAPGYQDGDRQVGPYRAVGMQQLVDAVRSTGSTQPVLVEGLDWGNDLSGVLTHRIDDPVHQLAFSWHVYTTSGCRTASCWDATVLPVARRYPVLITEFGDYDCSGIFVTQVMSWADAHHIGYVAWTWDDWPGCGGPSLIRNYAGTPTALGRAVEQHYRAVARRDSRRGAAARATEAPRRAATWAANWMLAGQAETPQQVRASFEG